MIGVIRSGYNLSLKNFEGPLDLLLELIQNEKLDITEISISSITDQYLIYLKTMQLFNVDIASEFFVIAATLVYIKTRKLLPFSRDDENEDIMDEKELIEKLKEYRKYRILARYLWQLKEAGDVYYSRDYSIPVAGTSINIDYSEKLEIGDLIRAAFRYKGVFIRKPIPIKRREVSVEEKMTTIMNLLNIKRIIKFSELAAREETKIDKVASFLGGLELSFRQKVLLKQLSLFSDIDIIKKQDTLL